MLQSKRTTRHIPDDVLWGDAILSRLYRAQPAEVASIIEPLPKEVRVGLAAFCYGRAHLRPLGREIANCCEEADLMRHAGRALGLCLVDARRTQQGEKFGVSPDRLRPKVTLATAADMRRRILPGVNEADDNFF